jgi:hypothetical protein
MIRDAKQLQAAGDAFQGHPDLATIMSRWLSVVMQVALQAAVGEQLQAHSYAQSYPEAVEAGWHDHG